MLSAVVAAAVAAAVAADAADAVPVGAAGEAAAGAAPAAVDAVASHPRSLRTLRCSTVSTAACPCPALRVQLLPEKSESQQHQPAQRVRAPAGIQAPVPFEGLRRRARLSSVYVAKDGLRGVGENS